MLMPGQRDEWPAPGATSFCQNDVTAIAAIHAVDRRPSRSRWGMHQPDFVRTALGQKCIPCHTSNLEAMEGMSPAVAPYFRARDFLYPGRLEHPCVLRNAVVISRAHRDLFADTFERAEDHLNLVLEVLTVG